MAFKTPEEYVADVEENAVRIMNLEMGPDPINSVLMPTYSILLNKITSQEALDRLKASIGSRLESHVNVIAERVSAVRDPLDFLQAYAKEWSRFKASCACFEAAIKRLFVDKPNSSGGPSTTGGGAAAAAASSAASSSAAAAQRSKVEQSPTRAFCFGFWKTALLDPLKPRIQPAIFELLGQQRAGGLSEFEHVRFAVDSYRELDPQLKTYQTEFEAPFLDHTRNYYHAAAAKSLQMDGAAGYLDFCDRVLQLEEKIASQYLAPTSAEPHRERVNQAIILDHLEVIQEVLGTIFDRTNSAATAGESLTAANEQLLLDLRRIYVIFDRIDKIDDLLTIFEAQVERVFAKRFEELVPQASSKDREVIKNFPTAYCQAFLTEYYQFLNTIDVCFNSSARFVSVLDRAARTSLNNNAIHKPGDTREPSPTLTARYADLLLVDRTIKLDDLKNNRLMLPGIKLLASLLGSKDYFQNQYKRLFSIRLLSGTRASTDAEIFLIQLFRTVLSVQFSQELLVMVRDMEIWQRNRPAYFATFVEQRLPKIDDGADYRVPTGFAFEPQILTAQSWPLDSWDKNTTMKLPSGVREISEGFCAHYTAQNDGKQVTWMHERSTAQMEYRLGARTYLVTVNHFQLAAFQALLGKMLSLDELRTECELQVEWLEAALQSLLRAGLIQQHPKTKQYRHNPKFEFSQRVVSVVAPGVWVRPHLPDPDDVAVEIEEQRNQNTQAAIVRIMKARRVLHHTELLEAVQQQTSRFFPQTAERVKKQIDKLMQGPDIMLERLPNDRNSYKYVTEQN